MNAPDPSRVGEEEFARLLAAYDEALAAGTTQDFIQHTAVPDECLPRLRRAQDCLNLLAALWPGAPSARADHPLPDAAAAPDAARIGRFVLERELGRGGFGIVYLAHDPALQRHVALKVPRLEALWTAALGQRFLREAEVMGALDHPHIVPVYEAGEAGPVCYIASMYCPGVNLTQWLAQQPTSLSLRQAALLVATLAEALHYCHQRGILHRDLKPSNVMLVPTEEASPAAAIDELPFVPRLTDFGLAKLTEASVQETRSSVVLGTPLYMAPEQAEGRLHDIGPATDVYALGAILYETLAGRPPFEGVTLFAVLDQIRQQEPVQPGQGKPAVPRDLDTICLKCLHKEASGRYLSAQALADDLRRFLRGEPIQARATGIRDRLRAWSRRPERMGEAGVLAFLTGFSQLACAATGTMGALTGYLDTPDTNGTPWATMLATAIPPLLVWVMAWHTLGRRGWAIGTGAIATPFVAAWATLGLLGWWGTGGYFPAQDRVLHLIFLTMTASMLGLQSLWYLVALRAYYANRPPRTSS